MKELILRFKESFKKYDFESNNNITVLLDMINCILEMMNICDSDDHPKIKKLTSFLKLLSTDFCRDILDIGTIMDIYCLNVEGILEYLEEKYYVPEENGDGTKTVTQFNTEIGELCNDIVEDMQPKEEEQHNFFDNYKCQTFAPEPDVEVQQNNKGDPTDKDDLTLFNLIKETSKELRKNYINNKINIDDLRSIESWVNISLQHSLPSIRAVSTTLKSIVEILIKHLDLKMEVSKLNNKRIIHDFDFITIVEFDDK